MDPKIQPFQNKDRISPGRRRVDFYWGMVVGAALTFAVFSLYFKLGYVCPPAPTSLGCPLESALQVQLATDTLSVEEYSEGMMDTPLQLMTMPSSEDEDADNIKDLRTKQLVPTKRRLLAFTEYNLKYERKWPHCGNNRCYGGCSREFMQDKCDEEKDCDGFSFTTNSDTGWGCLKKCGFDDSYSGYGFDTHDYWEKKINEELRTSEILFRLYHQTGGSEWKRKDNWFFDYCQWNWHSDDGFRHVPRRGLFCDDSGQAKRLILRYNNLVGSIPTILGKFTQLTELDLSNNLLTGTIPTELGNLTELRFLHIHGQQSSRLTGEIPSQLKRLTNLYMLQLYGNNLSGSIPEELCNNDWYHNSYNPSLNSPLIDCANINCNCCTCYTHP